MVERKKSTLRTRPKAPFSFFQKKKVKPQRDFFLLHASFVNPNPRERPSAGRPSIELGVTAALK